MRTKPSKSRKLAKTKTPAFSKARKPTAAQIPVVKKSGNLILIYAGTFSAFRLKECFDMESAVKFLARNRITPDEFAIIQGSIISVPMAYRDKCSALFADDSTDELTDRKLEP